MRFLLKKTRWSIVQADKILAQYLSSQLVKILVLLWDSTPRQARILISLATSDMLPQLK